MYPATDPPNIMPALVDSLSSAENATTLLPFNARRDMKQVADLIELCFSDTLDPDGRRYLQQMRFAAENPRYLNWATSTLDTMNLPMNGFIYRHEGRLVGNLSLIPFQNQGQHNYLIANVAVHPEFRRRGIARQLTLKAIEDVQKRRAQAVWLHVRDENTAAIHLYQNLGFEERARRTTWFSQVDFQPPSIPLDIKIRPHPPQSWDLQRTWLLHQYPKELAWHFPLNLNELRPGWMAALQRFFNAHTIRQWTAYRNNRVCGVLTVQSSHSYADTIWLALPPDGDDASVGALLSAIRKSPLQHRPLTLDLPAGSANPALQANGFHAHQTLIWMQIRFQ